MQQENYLKNLELSLAKSLFLSQEKGGNDIRNNVAAPFNENLVLIDSFGETKFEERKALIT
jgi:hypothetical protein